MTLQEALIALHNARQASAEARALYDSAYSEWLAEIGAQLISHKKATADAEAAAYDAVVSIASGVFAETGDKNPSPAVQMKRTQRAEYDADALKAWAMAEAPELLQVDVKAAVKRADAPVQHVDEWKPYVSTKLDQVVWEATNES